MSPTAKSPTGAPTPDRASGYVFTDGSEYITTRAASDSAILGIDPAWRGPVPCSRRPRET